MGMDTLSLFHQPKDKSAAEIQKIASRYGAAKTHPFLTPKSDSQTAGKQDLAHDPALRYTA